MSIRVDRYDEGEIVYIALDPDGEWARSEFPDELVTVDYDANGNIIGIETVGSAARAAGEALLNSILRHKGFADRKAVRETLKPVAA